MKITYLMNLSEKIADQRHVNAIRRSLILIMPIIVIASFATIINNVPVLAYQQFMSDIFGKHWTILGETILNSSANIVSILLVISISYFLAEKHRLVKNNKVHPLLISLVAFSCLIALIQPITYENTSGIPFQWIGKAGIFFAIITGVAATEMFLFLFSLQKINIHMYFDEADPIISQAIASVMPAAITLGIFVLVKLSMVMGGISDIHQYTNNVIAGCFVNMQNNLGTALIYDTMVHFFWFFGMHGNDLLQPVMNNIYVIAGDANMAAASAGGQAGNIFTNSFFSNFVFMGGVGSTLCLIFVLMLISKHGNVVRLAQLSLVTGIFNINELLLFGLPIVLSPIYLLPFLLVPFVLTITSYIAMAAGFVPVTTNVVVWTTPPLLSGYLTTGSWSGVVLQLLNLAIGMVIYLPFAMLDEKRKLSEIQHAFSKFVLQIDLLRTASTKTLMDRRDRKGNIARILAHDLKKALAGQELFLEYQPQIHYSNRVIGVEALLRWTHEKYGRIPPPVIIAIAEDIDLINDVGNWVIDTACRQMGEWRNSGIKDLRMSINISVLQLYSDTLVEKISGAIQKNLLVPENIEIEITENIAMKNDNRTLQTLHALHQMGIRIAIDDFGMGHNSIRYIKHFPIDTLKIDRSLSHDIIQDKNSQEIISSINSLCSSLNIETIVEYVETVEQREMLKALGCCQYQGYLYSPALPPEKIIEFIQRIEWQR